jgi:hypothetical protein
MRSPSGRIQSSLGKDIDGTNGVECRIQWIDFELVPATLATECGVGDLGHYSLLPTMPQGGHDETILELSALILPGSVYVRKSRGSAHSSGSW